ncbi:MAG: hypothetical protein O2826_11830 [Chloroflexi bacterium]|nr:hypothetical protein [Chloroflexota bacterium]MDA1175188.1 hypothetical protein [Chloroflexota bacterium]
MRMMNVVTSMRRLAFVRWLFSAAAVLLLLTVLWGCATPTPTPAPTATPIPSAGPWVVAFDDIVVELNTPSEVDFQQLVLLHLALSNAGDETRTFYHGPDLAEFIVTKDGVQVMSSHDQLEFGNIQYTNVLGAGKTRRFETGFTAGTFEGVLIDRDFVALPVGDYEVYGIAHMGLTAEGEYEQFMTPSQPIRIVAAP